MRSKTESAASESTRIRFAAEWRPQLADTAVGTDELRGYR
jgi:hypothetical protein